jgi:hypothetical protein
MVYQPRNNLVIYEIRNQFANSHNNSNRWKNYFSLLIDVIDVMQIGIHTLNH